VNLRVVDGHVVVSVCNAGGPGRARKSRGAGLLGMQERVMAAGGSLDAGPTEDGWAIRVNVPASGPVDARSPVPT
jgi:signal transduction histidine kinase